MNKKDLREMRKKYKEVLLEIQEGLDRKKAYENMLKNPLIQAFLEVQKYKDFEPLEEKEMIRKVEPKVKTGDSNKIYVYMGSYVVEEFSTGLELERITYDNDLGSYRKYRDLETGEDINVCRDTEEFEATHFVIHVEPKLENNYFWIYNTLHFWFMKEILTKPQQEVIKRLRNPKTLEKIFAGDDTVSLTRTKKN